MKRLCFLLMMSGVQGIMAQELPDIIRETDSGQKVIIPPVTYAVNRSLLVLLNQTVDKEEQQSYKSNNGFPRWHFCEFVEGFYCTIHPTRNGYSTFVVSLRIDSTREENHPLRKELLQAIHYASKRFEAATVQEDQQTKISIKSLSNGIRYITLETYLSQEQLAVLLRDVSTSKRCDSESF